MGPGRIWRGGQGPGQLPPSENHLGCTAASHEEPLEACPPKAGQRESQLFSDLEKNSSRVPTMISQRAMCYWGKASSYSASLRGEKAGLSQQNIMNDFLLGAESKGGGVSSCLGPRSQRVGGPPAGPNSPNGTSLNTSPIFHDL